MGAQRQLAGILVIEKVHQLGLAEDERRFLGVERQRLAAPHRGRADALALEHGHVRGAALQEGRVHAREVDLALVPGLHEVVVGPAREAVGGGLGHVGGPVRGGAGARLRDHFVLAAEAGEVHLDAGLGLERLEDGRELVVTGPADEIQLARRSHGTADNPRRSDADRTCGRAGLQQSAAAEHAAFRLELGHQIIPPECPGPWAWAVATARRSCTPPNVDNEPI